MSNIFGSFDENIQALERKCSVTLVNREDALIISGSPEDTDHAEDVLHKLIAVAKSGEVVTLQHVNYLSTLSADEAKEDVRELLSDVVCFTKQGKPIRPKTLGQKRYVDQIRKHTLTCGIGPAGTGKTFLAMAMA
ncbi:MAG: PhoH family protein, partial [Firmicutes bacterium]|nr:PhoH family protein [Bacillota bacterium]